MVVTAVGVNSQTGIIFTLLGSTEDDDDDDEEEKKKEKEEKKKQKKSQYPRYLLSPFVADIDQSTQPVMRRCHRRLHFLWSNFSLTEIAAFTCVEIRTD